MDIASLIKDYGTVITIVSAILGYVFKKGIETRNQRKSLAVALLTEITELIDYYKKVELTAWDQTEHINIQSIEEEYMTIYNGAGSSLSLFDKDDIKKIISFYMYLKAHIDTIRVLVKIQSDYRYLIAAIEIFGHKNNSSGVVSTCLNEFKSTHQYALNSQQEMYTRAEKVKKALKKYT